MKHEVNFRQILLAYPKTPTLTLNRSLAGSSSVKVAIESWDEELRIGDDELGARDEDLGSE